MLAFPVKLKLFDLGFYLPVRTGPRFSNFQFSNRIWTSDSEVSKQSGHSSEPVQCKIIWSWCRRAAKFEAGLLRTSTFLPSWIFEAFVFVLEVVPDILVAVHGQSRYLRTVTRNCEIQVTRVWYVHPWSGNRNRYEVFRSLKNYWEPYLFKRIWT